MGDAGRLPTMTLTDVVAGHLHVGHMACDASPQT